MPSTCWPRPRGHRRLRPVEDDGWPAETARPGSARGLLRSCVRQQLTGMLASIDALSDDSGDQEWSAALERAQDLVRTLEAGEPVLGKVKGRVRRVSKLLAALGTTANRDLAADEATVSAMSPARPTRPDATTSGGWTRCAPAPRVPRSLAEDACQAAGGMAREPPRRTRTNAALPTAEPTPAQVTDE